MNVEQIMSRPVLTCSEGDTLNRAAQLMWDDDVGCIVVARDGRIQGILTDRDICMAAYTRGQPLLAIRVGEVMTRTVETIRAGERLEKAEQLMRVKQLRRVPVVDDSGALIGLVSLNDIAREAGLEHGRRKAEVTAQQVLETLAGICQPRQGHIVPATAA